MKTCTKCNVTQEDSNFSWRSKKKGQRNSWCKPCFNDYDKKKWDSSPERRKSNKDANRKRCDRNLQFAWNYLLNHPCVDCGEKDPIVLEFDHRDPTDKIHNISDMIRASYGLDTIEKEIEKCDVRCANCHRRRTAYQFGWYFSIDT
jgi:hypothetical protein